MNYRSGFSRVVSTVAALFMAVFCHQNTSAQISITPNQTALQLAQMLTGTGVIVTNASMTCPTNANGRFTNAFNPISLDSGILLTSGQALTVGTITGVNAPSAPNVAFASTNNSAPGDPALSALASATTNDACVLEFDFSPAGDTVKFQYVFGSEEYNCPTCGIGGYNFNCSFNDIFAFLISGPGIVGTKNIALVPGTLVPVGVSTINDGVGATATNQCGTQTLGNGPYTSYYHANYNVATSPLSYSGFTSVLTATQAVIPCNTYHLKLAIADETDFSYDSGVFLKAGSLNSNALAVTPVGSGGLSSPNPYVVRSCLPGKFIFSRPEARPTPLTVHYLIQGTAINGTDYTMIPDSVVIPANSTSANLLLYGLGPSAGNRQIVLKIISPYTCSSGLPLIIDSAKIDIFDRIRVHALTNDTTICRGESVQFALEQFPGDSNLTFNWTPASGLNNATIDSPIATPLTTTSYIVTSTLPSVGCPTEMDTVNVTVLQPAVVDAGPDITTCLNTPFTFNVNVSPAQPYTYTWSPGTSLNSTTVLNPVFTPTVTTGFVQYIIKATPGRPACANSDTVMVRVLPDDFTVLTPDTTICLGASVTIRANGDPNWSYHWTPSTGVSLANIIDPVITPPVTQTYTVTGMYPSCPTKTHTVKISVEPTLTVDAGPDQEKCQWESVNLHARVTPANFPGYSYSWTPSADLNVSNAADVVFTGQTSTTLNVTVSTPIGCKNTDDVFINVHQGNFGALSPANDTGICPDESFQLLATGGVRHQWTPDLYLSDANIPNPITRPQTSVRYTDLVTDQFGCTDTLLINVRVFNNAVLSLPDSVVLYPGETYQVNPNGNCLYFTWFPLSGLDNAHIGNPVLSPEVNTRYYIQANTEAGCKTNDSIDVIREQTIIDMPNAFAPGNGANNIFKPAYRGIVTLKSFSIYNRWGNKVFETSDINKGWDGTFNNEPQPLGVFVYQIEAVTNDGRRFKKQGNVTLIR